jgi:spore coat protein A, manganese oxidase
MQLTRRDLVKLGVLGTAALALPLERTARSALQVANRLDPARFPAVGQLPFAVPFDATPVPMTVQVPGVWIKPDHPAGRNPVSVLVDYYELRMQQAPVPMIPGVNDTQIWGYGGTAPGPTIHAEHGRPVLVRHYNALTDQHPVLLYGPPQTSVHLHGNPSLPQHDGYASDTTGFPQWKDYWYPTFEDARTLWYHDHGVHHTASNAYMGLAGLHLLHDDQERASGLPLRGQYDRYGNPLDVPFVLRDAMFDTDGQLIFDDGFESSAYGDVILVNGVPWPNMYVEPRKYRFRMLNASVSRSYAPFLTVKGSSTKLPLTFVGTDAGLMPVAQSGTSFRFGMAERYEVVIDFSRQAGKTLLLRNQNPNNNVGFPTIGTIMQFTVGPAPAKTTVNNGTAPGTVLRPAPESMTLTETGTMPQRTLSFDRENGHWKINGKTWEDVIKSRFTAALATPKLNDVEVWTLKNLHGGWFHPIHIHLIDFKVLSRSGKTVGVFPYERGPKDVVYVGENETVKIIARFGPQAGRYMIHCHNLVHEDHDMMHQFWVKSPDPDNGPIDYDPMGFRASRQNADGQLLLPEDNGVGPQFPPV